MSRAYRIKVRDSLSRVIRAEDSVRTQLEMLEILPCEQMAGLLAAELERHGFARQGNQLVRTANGVQVSVDPANGTITVTVEASAQIELATEKVGQAWEDIGEGVKAVQKQLAKEAKEELEQQATQRTAALRGTVTDRLEGALHDLRAELDQAINRVTGAALKIKAAQLGQIKQLTEDPQTGSLTIVLEV